MSVNDLVLSMVMAEVALDSVWSTVLVVRHIIRPLFEKRNHTMSKEGLLAGEKVELQGLCTEMD